MSSDTLALQSLPILIVDDEEIVLASIKATLAHENYDIVAISDPVKALVEIQQRAFALIISDQRMPGLTGLELLAQARQVQPHATRVLITAVPNLDTVVEAINKGEIFRFLIKPWLREEFLATVQNGLQRFELVSQNARLQAAWQAMNGQLAELSESLQEQSELAASQKRQLIEVKQALELSRLRSLNLGVQALEAFWPPLGHQARRTSQLCQSMARVLDLSPDERHTLETGALLHDLGLLGLPRDLIKKWLANITPIDPSEDAIIQQHPILGQELAAFGSEQKQAGLLIRCHHESFDGSGYPDKLAGEAIPWLARLLAIAVAYTSSPLSNGEALEKIRLGAGSAFDPEAVRVFLRALPLTPLPRKEKVITLADLRPGMTLSRGIYSSNGRLLAPEGQPLTRSFIEDLISQNKTQPITDSLMVFC